MGALSDRVGRRPVLIAASALMALTAWPAMIWLAAAPTFFRLMAVELWMSWLYASYNGAMIVFLAELVPEDVRTTAFSLSYSLATALFGGFTAAVCTWLIHLSGSNAAPGLWLTAAALTGLGSVCLARPKTGRPGDGASPAQRLE
jgi:MFS family permease